MTIGWNNRCPATRNKKKILPITSHCSVGNNDDGHDDDLVKVLSCHHSKTKDEEWALDEDVEIRTGECKKQSILSLFIFIVDCIIKCLATIFNKKSTGRGRQAGPTSIIVNDDYTIPAAIHKNTTEDTSTERSDLNERGFSSYLYSSNIGEDNESGHYAKQVQGPHRADTKGTIRIHDHHDEEGYLSSEKEGDWAHHRWNSYGRVSNGHEQNGPVLTDQPVLEGDYTHEQIIHRRKTHQRRGSANWFDHLRDDDLGSGLHAQRSIYIGEFQNGDYHGHGKMTWYDGGWYVGEWRHGTMHGYGKEVRPDGSLRHNGEWVGGHPLRSSPAARSIPSAYEMIVNNSDEERILVIKMQILDDYGRKSVYTGELSKATGKPHGKGCMEYRKQAFSVEGNSTQDLKTGRDAGISLSDGDLCDVGLDNDGVADARLKVSIAGLQDIVTKDVVLARKEQENMLLRQELNECQEQLTKLHAMVRQLKVDMDETAHDQDDTGKRKTAKSPTKPKNKNAERHSEDEDSNEDGYGEENEWKDDDDDGFEFGVRLENGEIYLRAIRPDGNLFVKKDREGSRALSISSSSRTGSTHTKFFDAICDKELKEMKQYEGLNQNSDKDVTYSNNPDEDTLFATDKQIVDPYGEKGVYTGALSKSTGMPNGKGRLEYEKEGRWYEGDWIHGRWTGYGRLSNGDGDFYEGGLKNDHKHGTGVMRFADGRVFEGEYIRGQMMEGKMTYQDGSVYVGFWVDGMRHGQGKCTFVDGSHYEGGFREGNFHGYGQMSWSDGGRYDGEWSDGEMHGHGKEIRPDGSVRHDGQWTRGNPIRR